MVISNWTAGFLQYKPSESLQPSNTEPKRALIILNQPFSLDLFHRLWTSCHWRCCADGGANRLYDRLDPVSRSQYVMSSVHQLITRCDAPLEYSYLPDLIKGDLDSIRADVQEYYTSKVCSVIAHNALIIFNFQGVPVARDGDQDSTDLMKCVASLQHKEQAERQGVRGLSQP
jgi:thiamine pyrophosphokinase